MPNAVLIFFGSVIRTFMVHYFYYYVHVCFVDMFVRLPMRRCSMLFGRAMRPMLRMYTCLDCDAVM